MRLLASGSFGLLARLHALHPDWFGALLAPSNRNPVPRGLPWAADNGGFRGFDPPAFRAFLARVRGLPGCLWLAVPDVWGDARATLALWGLWVGEVRSAGFRPALVAQDGAEGSDLPWADLACLFVGGSDRWRRSGACHGLLAEARQRGRALHLGRVNSFARVREAVALGYDSADGSGWSRWRTRDRARVPYLERSVRWLRAAHAQRTLPLEVS